MKKSQTTKTIEKINGIDYIKFSDVVHLIKFVEDTIKDVNTRRLPEIMEDFETGEKFATGNFFDKVEVDPFVYYRLREEFEEVKKKLNE